MTTYPTYGPLTGPILMIGFGSIGRGTLPLILRPFDVDPADVVVAPNDDGDHPLKQTGVRQLDASLTAANHREVLTPLLGGGRYVDTVIEPWVGYDDPDQPMAERTNYGFPTPRVSPSIVMRRS